MANRNDVANLAGVSGATVSRVFNKTLPVSSATEKKVLAAAKQLNYHPNIIASNFAKGKSSNIGVVIPYFPKIHTFSVYYFSEILSGIGKILNENNYNTILFMNETKENSKKSYEEYFNSGLVDGLIILGSDRRDTELLALYKKGLNFCLINNSFDNTDIPYADIDNVMGSYEAVSHLIQNGHKKIAFVNGPLYYKNSMDRLKGYKKALKKNNIEFKESYLFTGNYGRKSGFNAGEKILSLPELPTAIFCSNDRMAAGLIHFFNIKNIKIPQDISIIGYDNSDISRIIIPVLSTVHVPFFELGIECTKAFVESLNTHKSFEIVLKPRLVIRESSIKNDILNI